MRLVLQQPALGGVERCQCSCSAGGELIQSLGKVTWMIHSSEMSENKVGRAGSPCLRSLQSGRR